MAAKAAMRSLQDRIRYTISFELLLLACLIPAGMFVFDKPVLEIGTLGMILAALAMLLNLVYNWLFDKVDARSGRISSNRSQVGRILHAVGFEVTLTITSLPLYAWWLDISYLDAFLTDIVAASFVVGYTYIFTLAYDRLFPLKAPAATEPLSGFLN